MRFVLVCHRLIVKPQFLRALFLVGTTGNHLPTICVIPSPFCDARSVLFLVSLAALYSTAFNAHPLSALGICCVLWRELVAMNAVSFLGAKCDDCLATKHVFPVRDRFKVVWIQTGSHAALVIDLKSFGDRADVHLIR